MPHHPRRAYFCTSEKCVPPHRVFLAPGDREPPDCPDGHGRMQLQANVPYERPDTSLPIGRSKLVGPQTTKRRKPTRPSGNEAA